MFDGIVVIVSFSLDVAFRFVDLDMMLSIDEVVYLGLNSSSCNIPVIQLFV